MSERGGKVRIATVWLGGCSGCHMSFLDLDEWLFDLHERADIVFSPLADHKTFPAGVDIALVEGAVANEDNLALARDLRTKSTVVVSLGDCAVTGNVTALRNPNGAPADLLRRVYVDAPDGRGAMPQAPGILPPLLPRVQPLHAVVPVDAYVPGCPPSPERIRAALLVLLDGEGSFGIRFG
jgi:NAD-reducing hydrogenase small subunit